MQRLVSSENSRLYLRAGNMQPPALQSSACLQRMLRPIVGADGSWVPPFPSFPAGRLQLVELLGQGSFGQVYHAILDGRHLAVKYLVVSGLPNAELLAGCTRC